MGINSEIAHYFANVRKVPANNAYWRNKRIYVSFGLGFQVIPFMFDLVHKCGISTDVLLQEDHVTLMETGFDKVGLYELNEISFPEFLSQCKLLLQGKIKQAHLAADLFAVLSNNDTKYFQFETEHKALARSDSFLFTLVDLDVSDEWVNRFLPLWYSLARPILLLDDFKDLQEDRFHKEENIIIDLGNDGAAVQKAYEMGIKDCDVLETVNPQLSKHMKRLLNYSLQYDHIVKELN